MRGVKNQYNNYLAAAALQLWADHCSSVRLGVGSWVWLCVDGKAYGSLPNREIDGGGDRLPHHAHNLWGGIEATSPLKICIFVAPQESGVCIHTETLTSLG